MTSVARDQLRSIVERIERLKEEQDELGADIREIYTEAKSVGFDKTAIGRVITIRRKLAKDRLKYEEHESLVDLYMQALCMVRSDGASHTHAHARDLPEHDPETGELMDDTPVRHEKIIRRALSNPKVRAAATVRMAPIKETGELTDDGDADPDSQAKASAGNGGTIAQSEGRPASGDVSRASGGAGTAAPIPQAPARDEAATSPLTAGNRPAPDFPEMPEFLRRSA